MRYYLLLLGVLATWRLSHLVALEDGPWDLSRRLRHAAGEGFWGGLLGCFYCLSVWVAAPLAAWIGLRLEAGVGEVLLLWPALSAGAILLQRATEAPEPEPMAWQAVPYHEAPVPPGEAARPGPPRASGDGGAPPAPPGGTETREDPHVLR